MIPEFTDFTYDDGKGGFNEVSDEDFAKLEQHIIKGGNSFIKRVEVVLPHLLIWWDSPHRNDYREKCFAGLNAIWLPTVLNEIHPNIDDIPLHIFYNNDRGNEDVTATFSDEIEDDIASPEGPLRATMAKIHNHCSGSTAVTWWDEMLFVELIKLPESEHRQRLRLLPSKFRRSEVKLFYKNGGESPPGHHFFYLDIGDVQEETESTHSAYSEAYINGGPEADRSDDNQSVNNGTGSRDSSSTNAADGADDANGADDGADQPPMCRQN